MAEIIGPNGEPGIGSGQLGTTPGVQAVYNDMFGVVTGYTYQGKPLNSWMNDRGQTVYYLDRGIASGGTPSTPIGAPKASVANPNPNVVDAGTARSLLRQFGLDELANLVDGWIAGGLTWPQIEARLYDRATTEGGIVDRIYPELRLLQEGGQPPRSIAEIQTARLQTRQIISQEGFGDVLPDANAVARDYLVGGKSLVELQNRLQAIGDQALYITANDPAARADVDALTSYYGVAPTRQDLVNFALGGDIQSLHMKLQAVQIGGKAASTGFGAIDRSTAESLSLGGITADQAQQGFSQLAQGQALFSPLLGHNEDTITADEQIAATFQGNANAARRIARRQAQRVGEFQGGGGFTSSREGFGGVGAAVSR